MKFGSKLESFVVKEWADKYISYKTLNRLLKGAFRFKNRPKAEEDHEDNRLHSMLFSLHRRIADEGESQAPKLADHDREPEQEPEPEPFSVLVVPSERKVTFSDVGDIQLSPPGSPALSPARPETQEAEQVMRILADTFEETGHLTFGHLPELKKRLSEQIGDLAARVDLNVGAVEPYISSSMVHRPEPEVEEPEGDDRPQPGDASDRLLKSHSDYYLSRFNARAKQQRKRFLGNLSMFRKAAFTRFDTESLELSRRYKPKVGSAACLASFDKLLRVDIRKVIMHYASEMEYVAVLVKYLRRDILLRRAERNEAYTKLVQRAITALWESSDRLNSYLNTNILAVYKLLKKKDKLMGTDDLAELYPSYKEIFLSVDCFSETNDEIIALYNMISEPKNVEFADIKKKIESSMDFRFITPYYLPYLLGLCTMLFLVCAVLAASNFGLNVDYHVFLAHLPIFRLFIVFAALWFALGWAQRYLEIYGVNYQ